MSLPLPVSIRNSALNRMHCTSRLSGREKYSKADFLNVLNKKKLIDKV